MRLSKYRKSKSEPESGSGDSTGISRAIMRQLVKLRVATAVLVAAVVIEHVRTELGATLILGLGGACVIVATSVVQAKLKTSRAALAAVLAFLDCVVVLAVLASVGAESTDAMLLILALPLVHVAVAVGVGAMTVLWVVSSFSVMTWSVWTWDGASQPVTEAALTLVVLWIVAYVSGIVAGLLAQRAIDYRRATVVANQRSNIFQETMLGCLAIARSVDDAATVLCAEARQLTGGKARICGPNDRYLSRELVARANAGDGAAVVGRDAEQNCHIAVAIGRNRYLIVVGPPETHRFEIEAIELLGLQYRALSIRDAAPAGRNRRRSSDPASASLAEALDTSVLESDAPLASLRVLSEELPSPFELLGRDGDALAKTLLFGPG